MREWRGCLYLVAMMLTLAAAPGRAQEFSKRSELERKAVNDWMAERAKKMGDAHRIEVELSQAWGNPKYTSEAIEAQRKRYRKLQHELMLTQLELKRLVERVPLYEQRRKEMEAIQSQVESLTRKVDAQVGTSK